MKPQYRIVLIYLTVGVAWIFFSDNFVDQIFFRNEDITFAQNLKGWFFIVVSGIFLFFLIENDVNRITRLNTDLIDSYDQTISGWVKVMDLRHKETKDHTLRVTRMTLALAKLLGVSKEHELERIERGAILHDIGKIGIADDLLLKPEKLNEQEWVTMKSHTQIAHDLLTEIDFLSPSIAIPYCHHEKWDGSGYPQGLMGEAIPFEARMFAVVDVWDALIHPRVYKDAWSEDKVLKHIEEQAGRHFDPKVVSVFLKHYEDIKILASVN